MLGNDDPVSLRPLLDAAPWGTHAEGRVVMLDDRHEMISWGYSNITPWHSHREQTEEQLAATLRELATGLRDPERAIVNVHVPPFGTQLDDAPVLDADLRVVQVMGQVKFAPVGSTAVRDFVLETQPLLGLHGHIHESAGIRRLGRTIAINPGSDYCNRGAARRAGDAEGRARWRPTSWCEASAGGARRWSRSTSARPVRAPRPSRSRASGSSKSRRATRPPRPPGLGGAGPAGVAIRRRIGALALVSQLGARHRVVAIGLTGQCPSVCLVDASGRPVGAGLIYRDNRATAEAAAIRERFGDAAIHARTGHLPAAFHIAPEAAVAEDARARGRSRAPAAPCSPATSSRTP